MVKSLLKINITKEHLIKWLPIDNEQVIYTVREVRPGTADIGILFEEGVIGHCRTNGKELSLTVKVVREIQSPDDIAEVRQLVDDCQLVEAF